MSNIVISKKELLQLFSNTRNAASYYNQITDDLIEGLDNIILSD